MYVSFTLKFDIQPFLLMEIDGIYSAQVSPVCIKLPLNIKLTTSRSLAWQFGCCHFDFLLVASDIFLLLMAPVTSFDLATN